MNFTHDGITITDADSRLAVQNAVAAVRKAYNPKYVTIQEIAPQAGELTRLRVTVNAPTHYLSSFEDTTPKPCSSMYVDIAVPLGYPIQALSAAYQPDHRLASPNVFKNGNACIDGWRPFVSSLESTVEKLVNDIVHNPCVSNYDSPANSALIDWHKRGVAAHEFPTMDPALLHAPERRPLPPRNAAAVNRQPSAPARRPLPPRNSTNDRPSGTPARRPLPPRR